MLCVTFIIVSQMNLAVAYGSAQVKQSDNYKRENIKIKDIYQKAIDGKFFFEKKLSFFFMDRIRENLFMAKLCSSEKGSFSERKYDI
ncbi:hypothetical protein MFLO_00165 [Listeria floridensis FSL S10-1187]|uniref:Uncharacterized protein n=1 Tax=Listeria floridensis FSL S10-1187 TaxID=1265817 RepID=A0ABP3B111_9LIST|nr:hypothetical protein MFLO_00165 [Listeria floridensis FSL S10-1187]